MRIVIGQTCDTVVAFLLHTLHCCNNRGLIDRYAGPAFSKLFDDNSHLFLSFDPNIRSFVIPDAVRCARICAPQKRGHQFTSLAKTVTVLRVRTGQVSEAVADGVAAEVRSYQGVLSTSSSQLLSKLL